jgi:hypothetical protein
VYFTGLSGNTVAGPITVPGAPLSITPYQSGFVVLSQDTSALFMTQLSSTGQVLATLKQTGMGAGPGASNRFLDARGTADAYGVAFAVRVPGGLRLVRARMNLTDPMEVTTPWTPSSVGAGDRVDLSLLADGTLAIAYWETANGGAVHVRIASCAP